MITATRRQAREIAETYARQRAQEGDRVWLTPRVWVFDAWLRECHHQIWLGTDAPGYRLLNTTQEHALWERCITDTHDRPMSSRSRSGLARLAMKSWQLACEWRITPETLARQPGYPSGSFGEWAESFQHHCQTSGWLEGARLAESIEAAVDGGRIAVPGMITTYGFASLSPQGQSLLGRFEAAGCRVETAAGYPPASRCRREGFADLTAETEAAALWARRQLAANPGARIGIVVSDLAARRNEVGRIFADVLSPGAVLPGSAATADAFHISLGKPGDIYPLIAHALLIVRLACGEIDYREAGRLLRSPFIAGGLSGAAARATVDLDLRRRGWRRVDARKMAWLCRRAGDPLEATLVNLPDSSGARAPSEWASIFSMQLAAFGWPGERAVDSVEYQLLEYWRKSLSELASLDAVVTAVGAGRALTHLTRILQNSVFQSQDVGARVEIMGVLEAAGLRFDHLWVTGLHDEAWPPAPRPDPLLPATLQRELDMPSSSVENQLRHARWLLGAYLAGADDVVFSWPRRVADKEMAPSPLIRDIAESASGIEPLSVSYRQDQGHVSGALEHLDWANPPGMRRRRVDEGGTAVLTDQAQCAFRAFALHRLRATTLETPAIGLDPRTRGSVLHRAMESIWQRLGGSVGLADTSADELDTLIRSGVDGALARIAEFADDDRQRRHLALEARRLHGLIRQILDVERLRLPFRVVQLETRETVIVGGLELTVKLDRVDELPDGRLVVLDFKTGVAKPSDWCREPIREAQLPLYASTRDAPLAAVATISIRSGDIGFKGVAAEAAAIGEARELKLATPDSRYFNGWPDLIRSWQTQLDMLARNFLDGNAFVEPAPDACRYCQLGTLCRITELRRMEVDA